MARRHTAPTPEQLMAIHQEYHRQRSYYQAEGLMVDDAIENILFRDIATSVMGRRLTAMQLASIEVLIHICLDVQKAQGRLAPEPSGYCAGSR